METRNNVSYRKHSAFSSQNRGHAGLNGAATLREFICHLDWWSSCNIWLL